MFQFLESLKGFAPLGALVVFGWGVYQYYRSNELSFRKPYWEKLLALYTEATSSAALLARTSDSKEWETSRNTFWKLYYGPLCLVEDQAVENAMVEFGKILETISFETREQNRKALETRALNLAYACRDSIRSDWQVPLETLNQGKREQI